jgi:predicted enzyme involved in methoxymalonyl-ACP biosynthesis
MKNLELSLLRHTSIYNKAVSKFDSLKGNKNNIQSFLKKLENLRSAIEKKKKVTIPRISY